MANHIPRLQLFALGPPEARLGERLLTFPTHKTISLLIYLAVEAGMQPREHLAALLCPEASPERSHANLRNTLGHLQTVLRLASGQTQIPYLSITNQALSINPDANIDFDLRTIEHAYTLARRPFEPDAAKGIRQPTHLTVGRIHPAWRFSDRIFTG